MSAYETVQKGWIWIVLPVCAVVATGFSFVVEENDARLAMLVAGLVLLVLSAAFAHLRIRDEGDRLLIGFGPLPIFQRHIDYARITGVEIVKAPVWLGWGVRYWPGKGWAWILSGRALVRLKMGERVFHVGSPEPEELVAMVEERITPR